MNNNYGNFMVFLIGIVVITASLSTAFWGDFSEYGSIGKVYISIILVNAVGGFVFLQYVFNRRLILGMIEVPVEEKGIRIFVLLLATLIMLIPLFLALGVYR
ncbi:Uncharacterised protein [Halioglobus japonicus]|nr:Uncharacterised protein [Halioglobus japonicus]